MRIRYIVAVLCSFLTFGAGIFFVAYSLALQSSAASLSGKSPGLTGRTSPEDSAPLGNAEELPARAVFDMGGEQDIILEAYGDPAYRERVVEFFSELAGSEQIASAILANAADLEISPALAFALCWEESRYNVMAFNRNHNETVDRGLFQLNSGTFPDLPVEDFYDPEINAKHGLKHLLWCLNIAGTEVAGLAMYNAGTARVRSAGTPKGTLDYISRILKRQRKIEEQFAADYAGIVLADTFEEETEVKTPFRLSLLTPLGR